MYYYKRYYSLNLNVSEILDVFRNPEYLVYCNDNDCKINFKSIKVKFNQDKKMYIELIGTKDNKPIQYNVYEFEVYELVDNKEVKMEKWTKALCHYFQKVFGDSFLDAYNKVYKYNGENLQFNY